MRASGTPDPGENIRNHPSPFVAHPSSRPKAREEKSKWHTGSPRGAKWTDGGEKDKETEGKPAGCCDGRGTEVGGRGDHACANEPNVTGASADFPSVARFLRLARALRSFAAPPSDRPPSISLRKIRKSTRGQAFCRTFVLTPLQHLLDDTQAQRVIVDDENPEAGGETGVCDVGRHLVRLARSTRQTLAERGKAA